MVTFLYRRVLGVTLVVLRRIPVWVESAQSLALSPLVRSRSSARTTSDLSRLRVYHMPLVHEYMTYDHSHHAGWALNTRSTEPLHRRQPAGKLHTNNLEKPAASQARRRIGLLKVHGSVTAKVWQPALGGYFSVPPRTVWGFVASEVHFPVLQNYRNQSMTGY